MAVHRLALFPDAETEGCIDAAQPTQVIEGHGSTETRGCAGHMTVGNVHEPGQFLGDGCLGGCAGELNRSEERLDREKPKGQVCGDDGDRCFDE